MQLFAIMLFAAGMYWLIQLTCWQVAVALFLILWGNNISTSQRRR